MKNEKANLEARDDYQYTSLLFAVSWNRNEVIEVRLQYVPNVKAKDEQGNNATYYAAYLGYLDALKMVVEEDEDVIDLKGFNGESSLMVASMYGHHQVCEYLIAERKTNLESEDDDQKSALIAAAFKDQLEVIKTLIQHEANVKAKDLDGIHAA